MGYRVFSFRGYNISVSWFTTHKVQQSKMPNRYNHPDTTVYCQDTSLLLKHAIETSEGKNPKPLPSNDYRAYCQKMPRKGEVDMITGGMTASSLLVQG